MRKLGESELFKLNIKNPDEIEKVLSMKMGQNVGDITPKFIETELLTLKNSSKSSYRPLLNEALALYEGYNGRIRLFNFGTTEGGRTPVPSFMPFTITRLRDRAQADSGENISKDSTPCVLMNMRGIGRWTMDETGYAGLSALTDLYSVLETGVIMYRMLVEGLQQKVFSNTIVLEYLTKIYTYLFSKVIIGVASSFGIDEFKEDSAKFIIAKFFLRYVLKKPQTDTLDDIAYKSIKHRSSLIGLKMNEENSGIDYSSLSGFLSSFGLAFFNSGISILSFENGWIKKYGDGMALSIEYAPYLLHFIFATFHGASLGGSNRLYTFANDIRNDTAKLYNAVISEVK